MEVPSPTATQGVRMRMLRCSAALLSLSLAGSLCACGNKGDLVRPPKPPAPPATDQPPGATDTTPKPAASGTTPPGSTQDSGGH